jgi:hypothetical protein
MELTTTREVIQKLGGVRAVAELTRREYDTALKWNTQKSFPSNTYIVMTTALRDQGFSAPLSLWRMAPADQEAS